MFNVSDNFIILIGGLAIMFAFFGIASFIVWLFKLGE